MKNLTSFAKSDFDKVVSEWVSSDDFSGLSEYSLGTQIKFVHTAIDMCNAMSIANGNGVLDTDPFFFSVLSTLSKRFSVYGNKAYPASEKQLKVIIGRIREAYRQATYEDREFSSSLIVKSHPKKKVDTRSYEDRVEDKKKAHGIHEMSDGELNKLYDSLTPSDYLMEAVAHEVRGRKNARDTRTVEQQWIDAVSKNPNILH